MPKPLEWLVPNGGQVLWINLQADYERRIAKAKLRKELKEIQPLQAA